ncbi:MAG: MoxR family ATPase [Gammaproteobacteria bacterium]|nr:MAG: MoxR family ATPase [Gammaproteobacteria bacterium]
MQQEQATEKLLQLSANISSIIKGQDRTLRMILAALVSGGHVLVEDYPGTGKTTMAKALAASISANFQRIQFTPDLLPTDIMGVSIFEQETGQFRFHKGPIFSQILLADEINRASPRTQSALLEAMAEGQVSVEGQSHDLGKLFFVIATQNPVEMQGTYPLPEAQMDRFALRLELGYLDLEGEVEVLEQHKHGKPLDQLQPTCEVKDILDVQNVIEAVEISDELQHYIVRLVQSTRKAQGVALGASPRASLSLMRISRALAIFDDMNFVTPDHIHELAVPVLAHRLVLDNEAKFSGQTAEQVIRKVLDQVSVPR